MQVAEFVEVAHASQALLERGAALGGLAVLAGRGGIREAVQDLRLRCLVRCEAGEELRELLLYPLGGDDRLVTGAVGAAGGAVVAGFEVASAAGALHVCVAASAARESAQHVLRGWSAGLEGAGALTAHELHAVE
ncbi:MAG TPA: hypothetical protein VGX72_06030 [Solirubrobacteraceae bacterium]|nr:hypothetical protein [Solirubrobacteraceae bacterium]